MVKTLPLLLILQGCSLSRSVGGYEIVSSYCPENAGAALTVELGHEEPGCGALSENGESLVLQFAHYPSQEAASFDVETGEVTGSWCEGEGGECFPIVSGVVELIAWEEWIGVSGSYDLIAEGEVVLRGEISAERCDLSGEC